MRYSLKFQRFFIRSGPQVQLQCVAGIEITMLLYNIDVMVYVVRLSYESSVGGIYVLGGVSLGGGGSGLA